jgi:hypothetical protein
MKTRLYYSLNQTALDIWRMLGSGAEAQRLSQNLTESYEVDGQRAMAAVDSFLDALKREQLIVESDPTAAAVSSGPEAQAERSDSASRRFVPPELIQHDEPLHEVGASPFDPQLPLAE